MTNKRDARQAFMILQGWDAAKVQTDSGYVYGIVRGTEYIWKSCGGVWFDGSVSVSEVERILWDVYPGRMIRSLYHQMLKRHDKDSI